MTTNLFEATATIAEALLPIVEGIPCDATLPDAASRSTLSDLVRSLKEASMDRTSATARPLDAVGRFGAIGSAVEAVPDEGAASRTVSGTYLASFVRLALDRADMSSDKLCRWLGFAEGVVAARGVRLPDGAGPSVDVRPDLDELSYRLGYVQGALAAYGLLDVDEERDRTRPIFHAAYAAMGMARPETIEVRT